MELARIKCVFKLFDVIHCNTNESPGQKLYQVSERATDAVHESIQQHLIEYYKSHYGKYITCDYNLYPDSFEFGVQENGVEFKQGYIMYIVIKTQNDIDIKDNFFKIMYGDKVNSLSSEFYHYSMVEDALLQLSKRSGFCIMRTIKTYIQ